MTRPRAITEAEVRRAGGGSRTLPVPKGAVVTPAARDLAKQLGVALVSAGTGSREPGAVSSTRAASDTPHPTPHTLPLIALGADHGGFPMKEHLKGLLAELGYNVLDVGTNGTEPVDYPDFAVLVARAVADARAWRGIMVDGAGIGSSMAANKVAGIRAALCYDLTTAQNAREHNDANVLTLGGTLIGTRLASDIVRAFLTTPFAGGRHARRVEKINQLDSGRG
jgi:ribose 5-phosphate isomerase B